MSVKTAIAKICRMETRLRTTIESCCDVQREYQRALDSLDSVILRHRKEQILRVPSKDFAQLELAETNKPQAYF